MSEFDAAGGPWGYRLRRNASIAGIDLYFEANTWSNQPTPRLQGTIPDQTIYVGANAAGESFLERHNWFNQGAMYRAVAANYPSYPNVTVVDYYNLHAVLPILPELEVQAGGTVDIAPLLGLLALPVVVANPFLRRALLALISGCAATTAQRTAVATSLGLDAGATAILIDHGVLLDALMGIFTTVDEAVIAETLSLLPGPIKDQLHLIVLDEALPAAGGYGSGGIIVISQHATGAGGFVAYPSGRQVPGVYQSLQSLLVHEVGHMCDAASVGPEATRWESIYAAGATDPNAFLYGSVYPLPTEDIIFLWIGYCADSATVVAEVAARGNAVLSQKLAHVIDLLPSIVPGTVPFFTTSPVSHHTAVSLVPVTRASGTVLGDDGMITSVNGVAF